MIALLDGWKIAALLSNLFKRIGKNQIAIRLMNAA